MGDNETYIKLYRKIEEWRWFKDSYMYHVFSWLLFHANVKDHYFKRDEIKRGSLVTSYNTIAEACGMSVSTVRRVIANLVSTHEIEKTVKDHYQIIHIVNYDEYQGCSKRTGKPQPVEHPVEQPTEHPVEHQYNNIKNINNGKNGKNNSASLQTYPCGVRDKPEWMDSEVWKVAKFRTVEDIPGLYQGDYDTYIEYAEDLHRQGKDVK